MNFWQVLALEPTAELKAIKKAYAVKVKRCKPENDPQGYQQLREAFETAKSFVKYCQSLSEQEQIEALAQFDQADTDVEGEKEPNTDASTATSSLQEPAQQPEPKEPAPQQPVIDKYAANYCEQENPPIDTAAQKQQQKEALFKFYEASSVKACEAIFDTLSPQAQIAKFQSILSSEEFAPIDCVRIFSDICLYKVLHWPVERVFPAVITDTMALEFGWYDEYASPEKTKALQLVKQRIDAFFLYENLLGDSAYHVSKRSPDMQKAASLLNRELDRRALRFANFRGGAVKENITNIVNYLVGSHDFRFYPKLNKASIRWWLDRQQKVTVELFPAIFIVLMSLSFMSAILQNLAIDWYDLHPLSQLAMTLAVPSFFLTVMWCYLWVYRYLERRMSNWNYQTRLPWLNENKRYRWLIFGYLSLLLSAGLATYPFSTVLIVVAVCLRIFTYGLFQIGFIWICTVFTWLLAVAHQLTNGYINLAMVMFITMTSITMINALIDVLPQKLRYGLGLAGKWALYLRIALVMLTSYSAILGINAL